MNIPDYLDDNSNQEILEDICILTGAKLCKNKDLKCEEDSFIPEEIFGKILFF